MKSKIALNRQMLFVNLSKCFFVFYVLYKNVISWTLFVIPGLSVILLVCALAMMLFCNSFKLLLSDCFGFYIAFLLYSVITGVIISVNVNTMLGNAKLIMEYCVSMYLIIKYTKCDNNIYFSLNVFILQGLAAVVLTLSMQILVGNRATFSEDMNVNIVGTMVAFSLEFMLYRFIRCPKRVRYILPVIVVCALFMLVIIQTVSKKAIIAGGIAIIFWFICCFRASFTKMNPFLRFFMLCILIFSLYYAYVWYSSEYSTEFDYMLWRFSLTTSGNSTIERKLFIESAMETFLNHPLFGVGLNNFRYYNSVREVYSHCFYTEILACSGLIGTILFCTPMVLSVVTIFKLLVFKSKHRTVYSREDKSELMYMIVMILVFMFSCTTQIIMHVYSLFYFMAVMIAYAGIEKRRISKPNEIGGTQFDQDAHKKSISINAYSRHI